uniref:Uncharacterized protein n=1 Tax=Cucumis melo TaxID=3656 RepID=A0A9I9EG61_CUCME
MGRRHSSSSSAEGSWFFEFFGRGVVGRQRSTAEGLFHGRALC